MVVKIEEIEVSWSPEHRLREVTRFMVRLVSYESKVAGRLEQYQRNEIAFPLSNVSSVHCNARTPDVRWNVAETMRLIVQVKMG